MTNNKKIPIFALEMKTQKQHIRLVIVDANYRSGHDFPMNRLGRCMCFYEK